MKTFLHKIKEKPSIPWLFLCYTIAIALLACLMPIVFNSFLKDEAWQHLVTYLLTDYAINTVLLCIGVGLLSMLIGVSTAYYTTRYKLFGHLLLEKGLILPLAVPSYLLAYALSGFFDYTGPFKQFSLILFGDRIGSHFYFDLQHLTGLVVVISLALYPYIYLGTKLVLQKAYKQFYETGISLSSSKNKIWYKILIPLTIPTVLGSCLLVIMECLNDYGASKYFGVNTLTTGVFRAWFSMNSLASSSKIAGMLLCFILLLIWCKKLVEGHKKYDLGLHHAKIKKEDISPFKKFLLTLWCWAPITLGVFIPLIFSVYAWVMSGNEPNFIDYKTLIWNSFITASLVALLAIAISFIWQFVIHYFQTKHFKSIAQLSSIGYTIPGAVIGIGVIGVVGFINQSFNIYLGGSFTILIFGLLFRLLAVAYQNTSSGFKLVPKSTSDLGKTLGVTPKKMLLSIYLPVNKQSLIIAFLFVFIDTLKELPLTLILRPFNFDTLATKTYEYANDELLYASFHVAPFIILISIIPIFLLQKNQSNA